MSLERITHLQLLNNQRFSFQHPLQNQRSPNHKLTLLFNMRQLVFYQFISPVFAKRVFAFGFSGTGSSWLRSSSSTPHRIECPSFGLVRGLFSTDFFSSFIASPSARARPANDDQPPNFRRPVARMTVISRAKRFTRRMLSANRAGPDIGGA